jgi:hypothetical protein
MMAVELVDKTAWSLVARMVVEMAEKLDGS